MGEGFGVEGNFSRLADGQFGGDGFDVYEPVVEYDELVGGYLVFGVGGDDAEGDSRQ